MVKKRTVVIISLLTTIVLASTLLRTDIFRTDYTQSTVESGFVEIPEDETVATEGEELVIEEGAVVVSPVAPNLPAKRCYVSGCSGQLCSSKQGMMSTCEYKEEYACYQKATCEVQVGGECGWTETTELNSCRANAGTEAEAAAEITI